MIQVLAPVNPLGADATSGPALLYGHPVLFIEAAWGAGLNGSLYVEVTGDGTNWGEYSGSSISLSGSAGFQSWNLTGCGFLQARLYFSYSSGAGKITANAIPKGAQ